MAADLSLDTVLHVATSLALLLFGLGAWRAKRESTEVVTAKDIAGLTTALAHTNATLATKVGWKDFDRNTDTVRRELDLKIEPLGQRVHRLERKVFNRGDA